MTAEELREAGHAVPGTRDVDQSRLAAFMSPSTLDRRWMVRIPKFSKTSE